MVYYLYDSDKTVPASEYANFTIQGYQFHTFSETDVKILKNDWTIVRDFIKNFKKPWKIQKLNIQNFEATRQNDVHRHCTKMA